MIFPAPEGGGRTPSPSLPSPPIEPCQSRCIHCHSPTPYVFRCGRPRRVNCHYPSAESFSSLIYICIFYIVFFPVGVGWAGFAPIYFKIAKMVFPFSREFVANIITIEIEGKKNSNIFMIFFSKQSSPKNIGRVFPFTPAGCWRLACARAASRATHSGTPSSPPLRPWSGSGWWDQSSSASGSTMSRHA